MNTLNVNGLKISVKNIGAELSSIEYNGSEYLYDGNPKYWKGQSPIMFPICGRLTEKSYYYNGKRYEMDIHGIAKTAHFNLYEKTENSLTFVLSSNEDTKKSYPFDFDFLVSYIIDKNALTVEYTVKNKGTNVMYFSLGGHPAFKVPLYSNEDFTDYYLEFSAPAIAKKMDVLQGTNPNDPFDGKCFQTIPLKHEVFDYDDMFFYNTAKAVSLKSKNHDKSVTVEFEDFKYIGFWQMQYIKPPYLCIEPWTGSPSKKGIIDDLETKEDNFSLDANKTFSISYKIILT